MNEPAPANIFAINGKSYGVCQDCGQLVRIDKPILGSLHLCMLGEIKRRQEHEVWREDAMFEFMSMMGTYEQRKVARWEDAATQVVIDTCAITDSDQPYETGIERGNHPWVIVQTYASKKKAQQGHDAWVALAKQGKLPRRLKHGGSAALAKAVIGLGGNLDEKVDH